jgi:hypothetical protein
VILFAEKKNNFITTKSKVKYVIRFYIPTVQ